MIIGVIGAIAAIATAFGWRKVVVPFSELLRASDDLSEADVWPRNSVRAEGMFGKTDGGHLIVRVPERPCLPVRG